MRELRTRDETGAYRVIHLAALADRVLVLHAFRKKTRATAQRDLELAARRLAAGMEVLMEPKGYANAFEALFDDPAEVANLTARAELMALLRERVEAWGVTQGEAAKRLGLTRPRLNELLRGHIDRFSLDALVNLLPRAGLKLRSPLAEAA